MPRTDFHTFRDNPIQKLFWGRTSVESSTSLLYFNKGAKVQQMLHQLKYKGNTEIGEMLGQELGRSMNNSEYFKGITAVIPVPLHPKKEKLRGYNQSMMIARGVASMMAVETRKNLVKRTSTDSQTRKSRYDRWQNVESVFEIKEPESLYGKHILLIDDVVTTGATIEACVNELLKLPGTKVSVATIACAQ
jgi:ComF family protein